jgi:hypothetical protein
MWSGGFGCLQREAERKRVGGRSFVAAGKVSKLGLGINSFHAALKTDQPNQTGRVAPPQGKCRGNARNLQLMGFERKN